MNVFSGCGGQKCPNTYDHLVFPSKETLGLMGFRLALRLLAVLLAIFPLGSFMCACLAQGERHSPPLMEQANGERAVMAGTDDDDGESARGQVRTVHLLITTAGKLSFWHRRAPQRRRASIDFA